MKKTITFFIAVVAVTLTACGSSTSQSASTARSSEIGQNAAEQVAQAGEANEEYFEWSDNMIVALTEEGAKQESIVIPERCESFNGSIFAADDCMVQYVSFEGDGDVVLDGVFSCSDSIKKVSLPAGLTTIETMEFWACKSLEEIELPPLVTTIGEMAFKSCTSLKKVTLPNNSTEIKAYAFYGCESLEAIEIPDSVNTIEKYAFYECVSLDTVTLPKSLKNVEKFAFANCGLTKIIVPEEVELETYASTSFSQAYAVIDVVVTEGSWMDEHFDEVFESGFTKVVE